MKSSKCFHGLGLWCASSYCVAFVFHSNSSVRLLTGTYPGANIEENACKVTVLWNLKIVKFYMLQKNQQISFIECLTT